MTDAPTSLDALSLAARRVPRAGAEPSLPLRTERGPGAPVRTVRSREAAIDAALDMTFPASDPPAWTS